MFGSSARYRLATLLTLLGLMLVFAGPMTGCGGGTGNDGTSDGDNGDSDNGDEAPAGSEEWTEVALSFTGSNLPLTSTCTLLLPGETTYRMYFTGPGGLYSITSTDGINWGSPTGTGITDTGATNPAVIRLQNGTYLMIYGVQTNMPTTERQYRATSPDGITFTKQGDAVLVAEDDENDFVSVVDMIDLNATTLRMYFVADTVSSYVHTATSTDDGATWLREGRISLTGGEIGGQLNDPDIIQLADGTWRLFFTTNPEGQAIGDLRIRSATSTDGRSFTLESGDIATPSDTVEALMDPDVVLQLGTTDAYRLYYGGNLSGGGGPDQLRSLVSPEGDS